jgi:transposase
MNQVNRPGPARLDAAGLTRYLKAQGSKLPDRHALMMWLAVEQMLVLSRHLEQVERRIVEALAQAPGLSELAELLQSLPGVGPVVSATAIAEVGDFGRFDNPKVIVKYAGLCPRTFSSADTQRTGRITKTGPSDLRWVLQQQAAWVAVRTHEPLRLFYEKIKRRRNWKAAIVAVARKLLVIHWAVARRRQSYQVYPAIRKEACAPGRTGALPPASVGVAAGSQA